MNVIEVSNLKKDYMFSVKEKFFFKCKIKSVLEYSLERVILWM